MANAMISTTTAMIASDQRTRRQLTATRLVMAEACASPQPHPGTERPGTPGSTQAPLGTVLRSSTTFATAGSRSASLRAGMNVTLTRSALLLSVTHGKSAVAVLKRTLPSDSPVQQAHFSSLDDAVGSVATRPTPGFVKAYSAPTTSITTLSPIARPGSEPSSFFRRRHTRPS